MGQRRGSVAGVLLLSGLGAALAACTTPESYYGGYYGYPPGYYYPAPAYAYGSPWWWGGPWWWDGFVGERFIPQRRFSQQASPPPAQHNAAGPGFLGNATRPQASPAPSGGAQSGSSGGRRGFLGNVLRQRQ